jgi:translation initiation factor 2 beta subunit (eIF-2beta)/eIF-5
MNLDNLELTQEIEKVSKTADEELAAIRSELQAEKQKSFDLDFKANKLPKFKSAFAKLGGKEEGEARFIKEFKDEINSSVDDEKKLNEFLTKAKSNNENKLYFNFQTVDVAGTLNKNLKTSASEGQTNRVGETIYKTKF